MRKPGKRTKKNQKKEDCFEGGKKKKKSWSGHTYPPGDSKQSINGGANGRDGAVARQTRFNRSLGEGRKERKMRSQKNEF